MQKAAKTMTESTPAAQPTEAEFEIEIRVVVQKIANIADIPLTPEGLEGGVKIIKEALADGTIAQILRARAQNPDLFN
jgi:hypothetical protein